MQQFWSSKHLLARNKRIICKLSKNFAITAIFQSNLPIRSYGHTLGRHSQLILCCKIILVTKSTIYRKTSISSKYIDFSSIRVINNKGQTPVYEIDEKHRFYRLVSIIIEMYRFSSILVIDEKGETPVHEIDRFR